MEEVVDIFEDQEDEDEDDDGLLLEPMMVEDDDDAMKEAQGVPIVSHHRTLEEMLLEICVEVAMEDIPLACVFFTDPPRVFASICAEAGRVSPMMIEVARVLFGDDGRQAEEDQIIQTCIRLMTIACEREAYELFVSTPFPEIQNRWDELHRWFSIDNLNRLSPHGCFVTFQDPQSGQMHVRHLFSPERARDLGHKHLLMETIAKLIYSCSADEPFDVVTLLNHVDKEHHALLRFVSKCKDALDAK